MKTMKFVQKMASAGFGRTGVITDIPRLPEVSIQTPALMLYTKGGSIPHITHEVLQLISRAPHLVQLPLLSTLQMRAGVSAQGAGLATFCGLAEHPSLMVLQDPTLHTPATKLEKYVMPLWTRMGKMEIDTDMYMDIVECYKPDMYAPLCDGCTDASSSKKRISKSMDRSATMFHRCLERHKQSHYLSKNSSILGVIEGGHSLDQRMRCLDILLENKDEIGGFILDGIETNGPSLEDREIDSIRTIVEGVTARLPQDKLRLFQGCWNAVAILDLVALGWDLFDSTLPYQATEKGCGLSFSFHIDNKHSNDGNTEEKLEEENKMADASDQRCYEIDLSESRYAEDFRPIVEGCSCLCCSKYTRAYVNHLLLTKELLSSVLIMIHNLHHYMEFFKSIRENATTERLAAMRAIVYRQYSQHEEAKKLKEPKTSPAIEKPRRRRLSQEGVGDNHAQVKEGA